MFLVDWARQAEAWTDANDTSMAGVMYLLVIVIFSVGLAAWAALRALRRPRETPQRLLRAAWFCTSTAPRTAVLCVATSTFLIVATIFFACYFSALQGDRDRYGLPPRSGQPVFLMIVGAVGLPIEAWLTYRHSRKFYRVLRPLA